MSEGMMGGGMMVAMGLVWLLVVIVLALSAAALIKYLFSGRHDDDLRSITPWRRIAQRRGHGSQVVDIALLTELSGRCPPKK